MEPLPAVRHMSDHVLKHLALQREIETSSEHITRELDIRRGGLTDNPKPPLFVAVQGPQGSGKTFLTTRLQEALTSPPHSLSVVVLSIDDLYLPHDQLVAVAQAYPENRLLHGRGQPGTHDVKLGTEILTRLKRMNEDVEAGEVIHIPKFDKSLHGGEGDRVQEGNSVKGPVDVIILEGWCVGFYPSSREEIDRRFERPVQGLAKDFFRSRGFRKEDILDINERLRGLASWWLYFDTFIQVSLHTVQLYRYIECIG
jgi:D-glycerate 3-kinase